VNDTNKKSMGILVAVVVVVLVVASVGAYVLLFGGLGGGGGGGGGAVTVADASSLQFSVDASVAGATTTLQFSGKNIGTNSLLIRADILLNGQDIVCIMDTGAQKAWANTTGAFIEDSYTQDMHDWGNSWTTYLGHIQSWSAGNAEVTYADQGNQVRIYNIIINPALDDSFFTAT
jgi:hypothetical protein